jgi:predicted alpha/beta hydrolase family esterase
MKNAIILHGLCDDDEYYDSNEPSPSNNNWIPWLQKQLMINDYNCQTPEVPFSYRGIYKDWLSVFESFKVDRETILIGHSAGCSFFLKWLSQNNKSIDKIYMVAPWIDPFKEVNPYNNKEENKDFLQCELASDINSRVKEMHIICSDNDHVKGVNETIEVISEIYKKILKKHYFKGYGHFNPKQMGTNEFPELLEIVLEK